MATKKQTISFYGEKGFARSRFIQWRLKRMDDGYRGYIYMPATIPGVGPIKVATKATTKAGALSSAADIAASIASNPLMAAILPPGSGVAVKAIGSIAKAAGVGELGSALTKYAGSGVKRLVSALKFW